MNDEDPRERLRRLLDALDDEPPDDEEAREVVRALGVDLPALAARLQAKAAKADLDARGPERRAPRAREPVRPRADQIQRIRALATRPGAGAVAAHFRKLEDAGDEELAAILTALRDLLEPHE